MQLAELVACRRGRARRPARRAGAAPGSRDQRPGERDPLPHAVGQRCRAAGRRRRRRRARPAPPARASRSARSSRSERGSPSSADASPARRAALGARPSRSRARSAREQPDALQRAGDAEAGELRAAGRRAAARRASATSPASGATKPQMTLNSVVLPAPLGPMTPTTSPGATVERDVVERGEAAEADGDRVDAQPVSPGALVGGHGIPFVPRGRDLHAQRHGATVWVATPVLIVRACPNFRRPRCGPRTTSAGASAGSAPRAGRRAPRR